MTLKTYLLLSFFLLSILTGCTNTSDNYELTEEEKKICDSLKIDPTVVQNIRAYNTNKIEPFHYSLSKIIVNGEAKEADPIFRQGIVFTEQNAKSYETVFGLKDELRKKGYTIFLLENNFNIDNQSDYIGVLKTADQFSVLKQVGTDGINYEIDNDSLITLMQQFDKQYSLELIGASGDWCEFIIHKEPTDWMAFAKEVYKVCPDVVDQGAGDVEALAGEMKNTKRLYFWWD